MDISSRNVQSPAAAPGGHATTAGSPRKPSSNKTGLWGRIAVVAAVAIVAILLIAIAVLAPSSGRKAESTFVDESKLQAVFLNTGQVYFGDLTTVNSQYFVLSNIYYLQTSNASSNGQAAANTNPNVTLVKLGCELHEPFDRMVINRDQVTFWENLHESGQVAKAVAQFKQQNPQGQKCADQSTSSSTNSTNSTQNANGNNGSSNTNSSNNSSTTGR